MAPESFSRINPHLVKTSFEAIDDDRPLAEVVAEATAFFSKQRVQGELVHYLEGEGVAQIDRLLAWLENRNMIEQLKSRIREIEGGLQKNLFQVTVQQRIADSILSDERGFREFMRGGGLEHVEEHFDTLWRKKGIVTGTDPLGITGAKGLASAMAVLESKGYDVYFPDPLLDALLKIDIIAEKDGTVLLVQAKAHREKGFDTVLVETADTFFKRGEARSEIPRFVRGQQYEDLADDVVVLENAAKAMRQRYNTDAVVPVVWVTPTFDAKEDTSLLFDMETSLPRRDSYDKIVLPTFQEE